MNEQRQDCELLREFVRRGDQPAFATLVRRHLDLVYATALRRVEDAGAAEEVAQNVFAALARKAWRFAPDDSLPAWLYRATLLEAKSHLRSELRRRQREQTAAALGTTMNNPDESPALRKLVPLLDDTLLTLREQDRTALLLRYYENRSLREVGAALGIQEDAAQKRVAGALEELARAFQRRGYRTVGIAAVAAVLEHSAASTPALVASAILERALPGAPGVLAALKAVLSRLAGLTKAQTAVLCVALAGAPVGWEAHRTRAALRDAATAQAKLASDRTDQEDLSAELERSRKESTRLALVLDDMDSARVRRQAALRNLAALQGRVLALLTTNNYQWPDELPFVRIPKRAIKEIEPGKGIDREGKLSDSSAELLGMTPEERQESERSLGHLTRAMADLAAMHAYETNFLPPRLNSPDWLVYKSKTVAVPALGTEAEAMVGETLRQLARVLGEDRAGLVLGDASARKNGAGRDTWLGACVELSETPQLFTAFVSPGSTNGIFVGVFRTDAAGSEGNTGVVPNRSEVRLWGMPPALNRFFDPWLWQFGLTNVESSAAP